MGISTVSSSGASFRTLVANKGERETRVTGDDVLCARISIARETSGNEAGDFYVSGSKLS